MLTERKQLTALTRSENLAAAVSLLKEALHLRMNGEYAPGGAENWGDWDHKTETFLRYLHETKENEMAAQQFDDTSSLTVMELTEALRRIDVTVKEKTLHFSEDGTLATGQVNDPQSLAEKIFTKITAPWATGVCSTHQVPDRNCRICTGAYDG
jgi:hypothetical protein